MNKNLAVVLVAVVAAGCAGTVELPLDPARKVSEQDCSGPINNPAGFNLMCRDVPEAERRAKAAEDERLARERKEAQERAARERAERQRAEALALEEAARRARLAEEERIAAEKRRLEEEAARKAKEERDRKERAEAEARAKREAALAECRRLETERLNGRALLENFVATYGQIEENKGIAGQITTFLNRPSRTKPCPEA